MVTAAPARLKNRRALSACWRYHFGGARLPNVRNAPEAHPAFLAREVCYVDALAEPWPRVCHIREGRKASGDAIRFARPRTFGLITRWAVARRVQWCSA
jgi:hypothetical protein